MLVVQCCILHQKPIIITFNFFTRTIIIFFTRNQKTTSSKKLIILIVLVLAGAEELADRGIRCTVVNPGPIDTGWMDDPTRRHLSSLTPGGTLGDTSTVADLVAFLLSDRGRWINGQRLLSNGGFAPTPL